MERIQSAIQKARIAREGKLPEAPARTAEARQPGPAPLSDHQLAWAALDVFQPNAAHLQRGRITTLEPGQLATPFDVMRTRLLKQMRANSWHRLAITSPSRLTTWKKACGTTLSTWSRSGGTGSG